MPVTSGRAQPHTPNRRGEGAKLREVILAAAGKILETTGDDDAVTLRAIAREAGITAPAIYAHFADRDEIKHTVIEQTFAELTDALHGAVDAVDDPVDRLRAACHAYLAFAASRPHHYRVLFERHRVESRPSTGPGHEPPRDVRTMMGADAFGVLLDATTACIASGASTAEVAELTATRIWVGLHGQAALQASMPWFPWPGRDELTDGMLDRLAELRR